MKPWLLAWFFSYSIFNLAGELIDLQVVGDQVIVATTAGVVDRKTVRGFDTETHCDRIKDATATRLLQQRQVQPTFSFMVDGKCLPDRVDKMPR